MKRIQRTASLLTAFALLLIGTGALLWRSLCVPVHVKTAPHSENPDNDVQRELEQLRAEVRSYGMLADGAARVAVANRQQLADLRTKDDAQPPPPEPAKIETQELSVEEISQRVDSEFEAEPVSSAWSREADPRARAQLTRSLSGDTQLADLQCRASICKAVLSYRDRKSYDAFSSRLSLNPPTNWTGQVVYSEPHERPDGTFEISEYLFAPERTPLSDLQGGG
jgi:hypothetical protein